MADTHHDIEAEIPRLRRYARALTRDVVSADDLVQDCLTRALGKLHLWQEGSDLRAWLFTILHNQYVNHIRRAVREGATVALNETEPMLSRAPQQGKRLELRDLERAIAQLPEEQRSVILLVALEGMRYEEVAAVLDVPVGTIRSRLSRGREALRRLTGVVPDEKAAAVISEFEASLRLGPTFARTRPAFASRGQQHSSASAAAPRPCRNCVYRRLGVVLGGLAARHKNFPSIAWNVFVTRELER